MFSIDEGTLTDGNLCSYESTGQNSNAQRLTILRIGTRHIHGETILLPDTNKRLMRVNMRLVGTIVSSRPILTMTSIRWYDGGGYIYWSEVYISSFGDFLGSGANDKDIVAYDDASGYWTDMSASEANLYIALAGQIFPLQMGNWSERFLNSTNESWVWRPCCA